MISLLRNCAHGGELAVYRVQNGDSTVYRKVAYTKAGLIDLERESQGWSWYQERRYKPAMFPLKKFEANQNFALLDITLIPGQKGRFYAGLNAQNVNLINKAFDHYCDIWPQADRVPLHGDFSIDNLLVNDEGIHILDWEHFHLEQAPWGFDPLYLLFETLWFSVQKKGKLDPKDLLIAKGVISGWFQKPNLAPVFRDRPLAACIEFIQDQKSLWGEQLQNFSDKLPILRFSEADIQKIDRALTGDSFD